MYFLAMINWQNVGVIATFGVAVASGLSYLIVHIFQLGKVANRLESVESDIKAVKKDVSGARKDLTVRIDEILKILATKGLSESHSPRRLSSVGKNVLSSSGIDVIVNDKYEYLLKKVKIINPANSYQAEKAVISSVEDLLQDLVIKDAIEEGAFNSGYTVASVLFVGGLYIRDRILSDLGFKVDEIDKHAE